MTPILAGIAGLTLDSSERDLFCKIKPAGYVLFSRNMESVAQIRSLTDDLASMNEFVPLIGIDQEGGRVIRTKALGVEAVEPSILAQGRNREKIAEAAYWTACILGQLGVNMNFAPVLDVCPEGECPSALSGRTWGKNIDEVVSNAGVYATHLVKNGISTCGKHFPGLGRACADPHRDLPIVESSLEDLLENDVIPFTALDESILHGIMTSHVLFPEIDADYPSSLSPRTITGLLRNQLGYEGLIMTDDLDMGAITNSFSLEEAVCRAILAGNDLAMVCHSFDKIESCAHLLGNLPEEFLNDRLYRVEDFLYKKMGTRLAFSEKRWQKALEGSRKFYESIHGDGEEKISDSPVYRY